ncbi:MAG: ATP-dependent helicase [Verrucomicrobia bacterium]|nr:ATP-dependent helicase [Verrucomicrobiota bacterium]
MKLLRGETVPPGLEPDEVRDRLLAGFQYILVDEYQDIDEPQYQLISALAGRTLDDPDQKLAILAVGDDDQNIYTFRGANVAFIRRFQQDYAADVHYLVENYRSTRCIIEASNQLIAANTDRMKTDHPICIDRHRSRLPAGGAWTERDPVTRGRVRVIQVPDSLAQAAAVIAALRRLREGGIADWSAIAVLSRGHEDLLRVRALAEQAGIPVRWWESRHQLPPLHRLREIHRFLGELAQQRQGLVRATDLVARAEARYTDCPANPWAAFLRRTLEAWVTESDDAELPVQEALEFLYESCAESRRDLSYGEGVTLSTVHAAKGTEHDHVILIGRWPLKGDVRAQEEERRVFYVGMTRARHSLTVLEPADVAPSLPASLDGPSVYRERASPRHPTSNRPPSTVMKCSRSRTST